MIFHQVKRYRLFYLIIASILLVSLSHAKTRDFIIDTDVGIDDVIAITYFLKHSDVQVKVITIETDGITHQESAIKNINNLLTLLDSTHIPVACGQNYPISGKTRQFSPLIMQINDSLAGTPIPITQPGVSTKCNSAEVLLTNVLDATEKPINILALGPLTTIAKVLQSHPALAKKMGTIYIMGGAIHAHGNIDDVIPSDNKTAEWNIYLDPAAAEIVFHSNLKIVLIPLDLTNHFPLNSGFDEQIKNNGAKSTKFIYDLLVNNRKTQPPDVWFFWDLLAAVIGTNPEVATFTTMLLSVKQMPDDQSGTTFIDKQHGAPIQVAINVDKKKFTSILSEVLKNN